jgi:mycofactocin precursor
MWRMTPEPTATAAEEIDANHPDELLAEDLVEEVSIDGMCGVY